MNIKHGERFVHVSTFCIMYVHVCDENLTSEIIIICEEFRLVTGVSLVARTDYFRPRDQVEGEVATGIIVSGTKTLTQNQNLVA
jgi:hypothetical protein